MPPTGVVRIGLGPGVRRAGSWGSNSGICLSANRYRLSPSSLSFLWGFRVLRSSVKSAARRRGVWFGSGGHRS